jgi:hypothetical protein
MRRGIQLPGGLQGVDESHANPGRSRVVRKQPTIDIRCGSGTPLLQHDIRQLLCSPERGRPSGGDARQALDRLLGSVQKLQGPREIALQFQIAALVAGGAMQQIEGNLGTAALKGDPTEQMQGADMIRVATENAAAFHLGGQELARVREPRRLGKLSRAARRISNRPAGLIHMLIHNCVPLARVHADRRKDRDAFRADSGGATTRSVSVPSRKPRSGLWETHTATLHRDRPCAGTDPIAVQSGAKHNVFDIDVPLTTFTPQWGR